MPSGTKGFLKGYTPWNKGKTMNDDFKRKCSISSEKNWQKPSFRKKMIDGMIGHHVSEETKKKIGLANKGKSHGSSWNKGLTKGNDSRVAKMAMARTGKGNPMFGKKLSKETKRKISIALSGNKSYLWIDGRSTKDPRDYHRYLEARRRARKRENGGSHTWEEWLNLKTKYNFTCPACGIIEPEIKLTEDHIVPLLHGGTDDISNIQPLCKSCNDSKGARIICCYLPRNDKRTPNYNLK